MNLKLITTALVAALAGGALVWWWRPSEPEKARDSALSHGGIQPGPAAAPSAMAKPASGNAETRKPSAADRALAELAGEVVVSHGKVEDIGRQAAVVMLAKKELKGLKGIQIPERTPEQRRRILELERQRADMLGVLPEVAGFQNNPDEYSRFFTGLIQSAAGLDQSQTSAVSDYMRSRGQEMVSAGLNAAKMPADAEAMDAWEVRRDAFNAATVAGVAAILPPGEADRIGFNNAFMELLERDFDRADE